MEDKSESVMMELVLESREWNRKWSNYGKTWQEKPKSAEEFVLELSEKYSIERKVR